MDLFDGAVLVLMSGLAVFFASVAVLEWRDSRLSRRSSNQRPDAQVIQHRRSDRKVNPAA